MMEYVDLKDVCSINMGHHLIQVVITKIMMAYLFSKGMQILVIYILLQEYGVMLLQK